MSDPRIEALGLKLGRDTTDANLDGVPRALAREALSPLPSMHGVDVWNAYEAGYLTTTGVPRALQLRLDYSAETPRIVESKSLKLYLNALADRTFPNQVDYTSQVATDLAAVVGGAVQVYVYEVETAPATVAAPGIALDRETIFQSDGGRAAILTQLASEPQQETFTAHSHLLRSLCPVTGQPDWGSVVVRLRGASHPEPALLLAYLLTFRNQQDFHESCCERIYVDLYRTLQPDHLDVACHYTRRGGIDINPRRASHPLSAVDWYPLWRQ